MIEIIGSKIFLDDNYEIREYYAEKGKVRALISNECTQSIIYIDKEKRGELGLDYLKFYDLPMNLNPNGTEYLMLGGGSISYPHHYINKFNDKKMDIVEINEKCIEYAKKYFYLDELFENSNGRLNIIVDDAIKYVSNINKQYDYILIDLFNGKEPVKELYNEENIVNLKSVLKNDGVIVINYIIINEADKEDLSRIVQITNNYKIITNNKYFNELNNIGNIIIVLSNNKINIPNSFDYDYIDITNKL